MTKATTLKGSQIMVLLGDDSDPIEYSAPCGMNGQSVTMTKNTNEQNVPDCEDPDAPSWLERDVESLSMEASGEGVIAMESLDTWMEAFDKTDPVPAKLRAKWPSGYTMTWTGKFHVTQVELQGNRGQRGQITVNLASHGKIDRAVEEPAT